MGQDLCGTNYTAVGQWNYLSRQIRVVKFPVKLVRLVIDLHLGSMSPSPGLQPREKTDKKPFTPDLQETLLKTNALPQRLDENVEVTLP